MKVTLLFFYLFVNLLHGQEIEAIRKQDTVYILFKADKNQVKICNKNNENSGYYFFNGDDIFFGKNKKGIYYYSNTNAFTKIWKPAKDKFVNKSFLVKYKNEIIDFDFLKRLAEKEISFIDFSESKKVYYIIDQENYKKDKIKLSEVNPPLIVME